MTTIQLTADDLPDTIRPKKHPLVSSLVSDIAEWWGKDEELVIAFLSKATEALAKVWNAKGNQTEEEFYKRSDVGLLYIFDLANWHINGGGAPLENLEELEGLCVLDFGAGIGTWTLAAAQSGAQVTYRDVNPVLKNFAMWRAAKYKISLEKGSLCYEVIVAWDVFEHLPDPEKTLDSLLKVLALKGRLVIRSPFGENTGGLHPMHNNKLDWESVLLSKGLVATSPFVYQREN